ncbi:choloylglycine hydrolase [Sporolactobacillus laevolacticus]|uniref:choloylglycine hydrolase n=1 Tax=Sporolactobacillus laevolacticus TaxID=33018 RepID=UPI0025B33373|nr:choloylglycine hydrolase [Sporolactobacillus laevolacticus]MDN3955563.1 choloylglycine hydrolase [Sporolactobacillus laevolacticus]
MCTSLTLETADGHHLFGRTMDFAIDLGQTVTIVPRNYSWRSAASGDLIKTKYGIVGMASVDQDLVVYADGMNEAGLTCATLYLPGFADYSDHATDGKEAVAPHDFVFWSLSRYGSIEEVKDALANVSLVEFPLAALQVTPPLHWILSDKTGKSIVVEPLDKGIKIYDNPVGVMTNSPDFPWHLTYLRQFIGLRPRQFESARWENLDLSAFSQGSGSVGLPGDFTPPSRFVRAAYWKNNITNIDTEQDGITGLFHILSTCDLPKGAVVTPEGLEDVTIYTSAMCAESGTFYYHGYDNRQITAVNLFREDLDAKTVKTYDFVRNQSIHFEN